MPSSLSLHWLLVFKVINLTKLPFSSEQYLMSSLTYQPGLLFVGFIYLMLGKRWGQPGDICVIGAQSDILWCQCLRFLRRFAQLGDERRSVASVCLPPLSLFAKVYPSLLRLYQCLPCIHSMPTPAAPEASITLNHTPQEVFCQFRQELFTLLRATTGPVR